MDLLPLNIPITGEAQHSFSRLAAPLPFNTQVKSSESIPETVKLYLDKILSSDDEINEGELENLTTILESYERNLKSRKHFEMFSNQFRTARTQIKSSSQNQRELTISNIETFRNNDDEPLFSDLIAEPINVEINSSLSFLKHALFIIKNPTEPLPDSNNNDGDDDDELQIEGGKIDLKCPITLQLFKDPYMSKKCGHTYDAEAIKTTFGTHGQICPTPGCPASLLASDFKRDDLMALRVKAFKKQEAKHKESYARV